MSAKPDGPEEWEERRDHHKSLGDSAFRSSDFIIAIKEYTHAIAFDPEFYLLYSNRSAAHLKNGEKSKSLADAKKCIELKPDFVKGHSRLATSLGSLGRWNEARNAYRHILSSLDESNEIAKKGLEDCRLLELKAKEKEFEMIRRKEDVKRAEDAAASEEEEKRIQDAKIAEAVSKDDVEEEDDLLNDFFDEVEESAAKKPLAASEDEKPKNDAPAENKIKILLNELGDARTQIDRLLRPHHEWYNLNPFEVLSISHLAPLDLVNRRFRAISLLLHPDKVRATMNGDKETIEKAERAFEYVRKAMSSLKDENKAKHYADLVEEGMKQGKKLAREENEGNDETGEHLKSFQEKATMKIFAEIERKRSDVERRKRNQEQRERSQEDEEVEKVKKERVFEKSWKEGTRVDKRINNWRSFQGDKKARH